MPRTLIGIAALVLALAVSAAWAGAQEILPAPDEAQASEPIIVTAHTLPAGSRQIVTTYEGSWNGFTALDIAIAATITPRSYAAIAQLTPDGLTDLTKHLRKSVNYEARSSGDMKSWGVPIPVDYIHHGGKKNREVEVNFTPEAVTTSARPRFGNYGFPPATPAQRLEAIDPLSAAIAMVSAEGGDVCNQTLKIFDGRARYNLILTRTGSDKIRTRGYKGPAIKCKIRYERLAGYDKPENGEKSFVDKPLTIWFAPTENGLQVPARIRIESNFGPVIVNLQSVKAITIS